MCATNHSPICTHRVCMKGWFWECKRLVKANLGARFPIMHYGKAWTRMGVVLLSICAPVFCSLCSSLQPSRCHSGEERKKKKRKNQSNYSSNYLIISLCGGEQEGGRRWSLCFLSPSVLRSWWWHLQIFQSITFLHRPSTMDSALPVQISLLLASSSSFIWPPAQICNPLCFPPPSVFACSLSLHPVRRRKKKARREGGAGAWKC